MSIFSSHGTKNADREDFLNLTADLPVGLLSCRESNTYNRTKRFRFEISGYTILDEQDIPVEVIRALFEYLKTGFSVFPKGSEEVALFRSYRNVWHHTPAGLYQYLQSQEDVHSKAVALWGFGSFELPEKTIREAVQTHLKRAITPTDLESGLLFLAPAFSDQSYSDANFLLKVVDSAKDYRIFSTPVGLQIAQASFAIENKEELTAEEAATQVGDWSDFIAPPEYPRKSFKTLPFHTKKYRDFVLGLEAGELKKLFGKVPASSSADAAIELSNSLIKGSTSSMRDQLTYVASTFAEVAPLLAHYENTNAFKEIFNLFMDIYAQPNRVKVASAYALNVNSKHMIDWRALLNNLYNFSITRWVRPANMADLVIEKMLEAMTPAEAGKVIVEVGSEGKNLTVKQWEVFIENADTYKDLPVGWWLPLVKRASAD